MVAENANGNATTLEMQDGPPKSKRNRTRIAVTVILGTLVLGFIILGTVLLSGQPAPRQINGAAAAQRRNIRGIELEEILNGQLSASSFNGTFISGNEILYRTRNADVAIFNVDTKTVEILLPGNHPALSGAVSYELSPDRKYLLIAHYRQKLYRYSFIGNYDMVDVSTRISLPLTSIDGFRLHLLAVWGPVGNAIVFVTHNTHDIYYKSSVTAPPRRLTNSGVPGIVYNGVPDWVNEEEILGSNRALWFSPDGQWLAFAQYNDSVTRIMSIPYYGLPGNLDFQYTRAVNIRYPKPGTPNPTITLFVAPLNSNSPPVAISPPKELNGADPILATAEWASEDNLLATWLNRIQNESYVSLCTPGSQTCRNILEMKESKGWITVVPPKIMANGTKLAMILPQTQESGGQFRQLCIGELGDNGEYSVRALTRGEITVNEILITNEQKQTIMYQAISKESPEIQHVYEVSMLERSEPRCMTCSSKTRLQKRPCLYNTAAGMGDVYALSCLGPGVPEITIHNKDGEKTTWEDNRQIYEDVRSRQMPIIERLKVKVAGGFEAAVALHLPPDIDRSGNVKYPLLVHVYGGPDSSQSSERFGVDWNTYLAVNRSIIYASIDGRGSGNKGNDMLFSVFRNLGTVEIEDQISVTRFIQNKFPFIDKGRSAIWGWSYGGYATTMALIKDKKNVFKCGIAVAPVSDWALYDTIYTERYMGIPRPDDNLSGYALAQLNDKVENLRNKEFFLVHGTLDDNVHYQQSMLLAKALEQNDILFRQQSYPDEDHGLLGVRPHLYHSLERFLDECFVPNEVR